MINNIELILFDLDGTLVDSLTDITNGVNYVLKKAGISPLPENVVKGFIGSGVSTLIRHCLGNKATDKNVAEGVRLFREFYIDHCVEYTKLYPTALETIQHFHPRTKMAIITNKPYDSARMIINSLNLSHFFIELLAADSLEEKKPHPMPVNYILDKFNFKPSNTIIVGDSIEDIECGKNAGIFTCGVTYGIGSKEEILTSSADCTIDLLSQLKGIININDKKMFNCL